MTAMKTYSILITDDDPGCREALRDIVEPEGFRTLLASSGEEAVDIVREESVHLLLLDMHMPRLTGLETMELVRQGLWPLAIAVGFTTGLAPAVRFAGLIYVLVGLRMP